MAKINSDQRCQYCNSLITFDHSRKEASGEYTPLDLNHKRHFCSSADKIVHECQTIENVKNIIDEVNKTELSSFELELRIVDGVKK